MIFLLHRDATANVVILSEDPNTGEITQEIVSAEQLQQLQQQAEENAQQSVTEDSQVSEVSTDHVELTDDQLISSQVVSVKLHSLVSVALFSGGNDPQNAPYEF